MPTELQILGWKSAGLRCPDHEIDCTDDQGEPHHVTFIQMPNGTGKTTTLSLLRAAMSGGGEQSQSIWENQKISEFKKNDEITLGQFWLFLKLNEKRLTIIMEIDFQANTVNYKTTFHTGQVPGFKPPHELRRFMKPEFVKFFIFDGEQAQLLLDRNYTNAQTAVESLYQIHLLRQMEKKIDGYWESKTVLLTARDETGFTRRRNLLGKWRNRRKTVLDKMKIIQSELSAAEKDLKNWKIKYENELDKEKVIAEKVKESKLNVDNLTNKVEGKTKQVTDEMRDPHALSRDFALMVSGLKSGLDRVKLPESVAREFFYELAEESECVCGREIDRNIKQIIRERAKQYLGSEDVSLLNSMKTAIWDAVGNSYTQAEQDLSQSISTLSGLVSELQEAQNELDVLKIEAEESDPAVREASEKIKELELEVSKHKQDLSQYEGEDNLEKNKIDNSQLENVNIEKLYAIATINQGIEKLEELVDEIRKTIKLRKKRDKLKEILRNAHSKAQRVIANEIREEANRKIVELMPYNNIRIKNIEKNLELEDKTSGSVGETLAVGYAFLSTLFNRAEQHKLPFVADSPVIPIDYDNRENIGELIPKLTDQFIAFIISPERERFINSVKTACRSPLQSVKLFRKGFSHLEPKALQQPLCYKTLDGLIVIGETFFNEFQTEGDKT